MQIRRERFGSSVEGAGKAPNYANSIILIFVVNQRSRATKNLDFHSISDGKKDSRRRVRLLAISYWHDTSRWFDAGHRRATWRVSSQGRLLFFCKLEHNGGRGQDDP